MRDGITFFKLFFWMFWIARGVMSFLLGLILLGGLLFSLLEKVPIGTGVYFSFITGFTIGFGDVVPHSIWGRIIAVLVGIIGVIFMGLIVGIATNATRLIIFRRRGDSVWDLSSEIGRHF